MKPKPSLRWATLLTFLASWIPASIGVCGAVLDVPGDKPSIQAAIDAAADGDTITIAAGLYEEHLLIQKKNLTLVGAPGTTLRATEGMPAILGYGTVFMVGIDRCTNVVLRGLTFDGDRLGEAYRTIGYGGVVYHGSGGRVESCRFHGFRYRDSMDGGFGWTGLSAINEIVNGAPDLQIVGCRFSDNGSSIHLRGNGTALTQQRLTFTIRDNVIEGIGPTGLGAQVGISISYGASGLVIGNRISDHHDLEDLAGKSSYGILAIDWNFSVGFRANARGLLPVRYENNTFIANQWAIASIASPDSEFVGNLVEGVSPRTSTGFGITGATNRVSNNSFSRVTRGVALIGTDPVFGNALGRAISPTLTDNRFCDVVTPVVVQPLVTGVTETGSLVCPFEAPILVIHPAVTLTFPAYERGLMIETAPTANGPWSVVNPDPPIVFQGITASATVAADAAAAVFRLRKTSTLVPPVQPETAP